MNYIYRKTYTVPGSPVVLLVEPDLEALALYSRHFNAARLAVVACPDLAQAFDHVRQLQPQAMVLNPTADLSQSMDVLATIVALFPQLPIVTLGTTIPERYLDRFMSSGVTMHINRGLSHPRDVVTAVTQVLALNS